MLKLQILMGLSSLTNSLNASGSCRYHLGIHKDLARSTLSVLYLILRQMSSYEGKNFTDFISGLKVCLFERKDLFRWFAGIPPVINKPPAFSLQQELALWIYLGQMWFTSSNIWLMIISTLLIVRHLPLIPHPELRGNSASLNMNWSSVPILHTGSERCPRNTRQSRQVAAHRDFS